MAKVDESLTWFLKGIQEQLCERIVFQPFSVEKLNTICGVDVSYGRKEGVAVSVAWSVKDRSIVETVEYRAEPAFPYIPGYLFMREGPLMLASLRRLQNSPDLILVDGHGIAHPRRAGIAVFIGLLTNIPTLGVAKSILAGELGERKDAFIPIYLQGSLVGYMVVPNKGKRYYVSPGHLVRVEDIIDIVSSMGLDYPPPLQEAHRLSKERVMSVE